MRRWIVAGWLAGCAAGAQASDKPVYQPAPGWAKPAPAIDVTKLTADSPVLLTLDRQQRMEGGTVTSYVDLATRMASPEVVAQAGTLRATWQPQHGDLIVHTAEIVRGSQHIDLLAQGKRFEVLRREEQLDRRSIDGQLTATMPVEGLQVGDVLRFVASVTDSEPALQGGMGAAAVLPAGEANPGFQRARFVWSAATPVRWRSYAEGGRPVEARSGGDREVTLVGPLPKPSDLPGDAPLRFRKPPLIEASTFADWPAVSAVTAPLYATDGLIAPGSPLAGEVARIAAAESDPTRRAAAALQLVQEKVRYLYVGLENGNLVPQPPAQTWALRYGDCKAKTLLLLAMLRGLGIEAEAVLASATLGDLLPQRLPSAGAFDHVLVHATIAGRSLWLEGTTTGSRYADLGDTPPLRWVLPIRVGGAGLLAVPASAPANPTVTVALDIDQRAGIGLPALIHAVVTLHGPGAEFVGLAKSQGTKEQRDQAVQGVIGKIVDRTVAVTDYRLAYDPAQAVATVDATAIAGSLWRKRDGRFRLTLDHVVAPLSFEPDRARAAWASIPVATAAPDAQAYAIKVTLPFGVTGFTLDGDRSMSTTLAGSVLHRTATINGATVVDDESVATTGAEIPAAEVPAQRAAVDLAKKRLAEVVAPAGIPPRWQIAEAGKRDDRFKPLLAAYAQGIAADPKESSVYSNRASFLLGVYEWRAAMPDLDRAIALEPTDTLYRQRAFVRQVLGDPVGQLADLHAANTLDPGSVDTVRALAEYDVDHGHAEAGLARMQARIDAGGETRTAMIAAKAELLARAGRGGDAVALLDDTIRTRPGNAELLNTRCWVKGLANIALDTALKDCTRAIELSEVSVAALDSRALIYVRMKRYDEALADLEAVLDQRPDEASSLYLRGLIRTRTGDPAAGRRDIAAATMIAPLLPDERKRFGILP